MNEPMEINLHIPKSNWFNGCKFLRKDASNGVQRVYPFRDLPPVQMDTEPHIQIAAICEPHNGHLFQRRLQRALLKHYTNLKRKWKICRWIPTRKLVTNKSTSPRLFLEEHLIFG